MRLLDESFKYVPAAQTDITQTWLRFGYRPTTEAERWARQHAVGTRLRRAPVSVSVRAVRVRSQAA